MVPNVNARGQSFKGVTAYLLYGELGAENPERVGWSMTGNLHTNDIEKAALVMAWTDGNRQDIRNSWREEQGLRPNNAGRGAEAGNVYHYSLAWKDGQAPDHQHMEDTAQASLERLGLSEHQYFMVSHEDTEHKHVHVVVNLVHPETGNIANVYKDHKKLDRWAHEYEQEHGIVCEDRAKKYHSWDKNQDYENGFAQADLSKKQRSEIYKEHLTAAYNQSDNGAAFVHAIEDKGLELAWSQRGKRGGFVVVDEQGEIYGLTRLITGAKKREVSALLKDVETDKLSGANALAEQKQAAYREVQQEQERNLVHERKEESAREEGRQGKAGLSERQKYTVERVEDHKGLAFNPMSNLQGWIDTRNRIEQGNINQNNLFADWQESAEEYKLLQPLDTSRNGRGNLEKYEHDQAEARKIEREALEKRAGVFTRQIQKTIREEAAHLHSEMTAEHAEEWRVFRRKNKAYDEQTILDMYQPEINRHKAALEELEGIAGSRLSSFFYKWRNGHSVAAAIEGEKKTIEDAQNKRDSYLNPVQNLKARQGRERQALKDDIEERMGEASGEGLKLAEEENQVLREAESSTEAAQRLAENVQAKTTNQKNRAAKVRRIAAQNDNKRMIKGQNEHTGRSAEEKAQEQEKKRQIDGGRLASLHFKQVKGQEYTNPYLNVPFRSEFEAAAPQVAQGQVGADNKPEYAPEDIERIRAEQSRAASLKDTYLDPEIEPEDPQDIERPER